jgi:hypothetical protein
MKSNRDLFQSVWGAALLIMGVAFFFRIPYAIEQVKTIEYFAPVAVFIRICFYIMVILLVGGGVKKLFGVWHSGDESDAPE